MIHRLTTEQLNFLGPARARQIEAEKEAQAEQRTVTEYINSNPFILQHSGNGNRANALSQAQQQTIAEYIASIGHPGAKLDVQGGTLVLVEPDPPAPVPPGTPQATVQQPAQPEQQ